MRIDRTIALARSRDGRVADQFGCRIQLDGGRATVGDCDLDPAALAASACAGWRRWRERLPADRHGQLVAEVGLVRDDGEIRAYETVQANGAILVDGSGATPPASVDTVAWDSCSSDVPLVLGPSATLALADFILDGIPGLLAPADWPFASRLVIDDTPYSPYPPQHRTGQPIRLGPASMTAENDDPAFMLLQRSERWQRPVGALYNISRRNLAIRWNGTTRRLGGAMIVLDTLSAETEPTLAVSRWLATWSLDGPDGRCFGRERLALTIDTGRAMREGIASVSPQQPACICDPIEGDVYGAAPCISIARATLTLSPVSP